MLWVFLIGIISINWLTKTDRIKSVNFSALFPTPSPYRGMIQNKKVMVLESGLQLYQHNALGGFFLNWELAKPLLEDMANYRHVEIVAACFEVDPPDVIVDKQDLMGPVMERIPIVASHYKREGNLYRKISN